MTAPRRVRVLVCDDDAMIREALCEVLDAEPDIAVLGTAGDADEAIELAERYEPSVVVMDLRMPGGGGVRAAREIRLRLPDTGILAFSAHGDSVMVAEVRRIGAVEYLRKGSGNSEIVAAVRRLGRTP